MQTDPQAILAAAMQLPESDRLVLASRLMDSVPTEATSIAFDDPELDAELERRLADSHPGISWAELKAEG